MTSFDYLLQILLDPDSYLHPSRLPMAPEAWLSLTRATRNALIVAQYGLGDAPLETIPIDACTAILLRSWAWIPELCLLLGLFSQRAEWRLSTRYRQLSQYARRFLELPLPQLAVPAVARTSAVDPIACGLVALRMTYPTIPTVLSERLALCFPASTDNDATLLQRQLVAKGTQSWVSFTTFSTAMCYAKNLAQDIREGTGSRG